MAQWFVNIVKRNVEVTILATVLMTAACTVTLVIASHMFATQEQMQETKAEIQEIKSKIDLVLIRLEAIEDKLSQRLDTMEERVNTNTSELIRHVEKPSHKN